jgi:hypothetical protein
MVSSKNHKGPTRRDFVEGAAYGTLGAILGLAAPGCSRRQVQPAVFQAENPKSRLVLVRDEQAVNDSGQPVAQVVRNMLDQAMLRFTGAADSSSAWKQLFNPGDVVGIKITRCQWMRVGTEQVVVDAVVARLSDLGLSSDQIVVRDAGMPLALCTALINVPAMKVHAVTGFAGALKNYINFSPTPQRYHHANNRMLGEVWLRPEVKDKTRLVIADLLRPYFGPGPQINPAYRWSYRGVMVGQDPVAVDTVALAICCQKRREYRSEEWPITPPPLQLVDAEQRYGLGVADPERIALLCEGWSEGLLVESNPLVYEPMSCRPAVLPGTRANAPSDNGNKRPPTRLQT